MLSRDRRWDRSRSSPSYTLSLFFHSIPSLPASSPFQLPKTLQSHIKQNGFLPRPCSARHRPARQGGEFELESHTRALCVFWTKFSSPSLRLALQIPRPQQPRAPELRPKGLRDPRPGRRVLFPCFLQHLWRVPR